MARVTALAACLAIAFALFYVFARTPAPLSASAPPKAFSAGRALIDIAAMAPVAHPIGSAANHAVRDYLMVRMTALGLAPSVQRDESHAARDVGGETYVSGGNVENIVGILPGRDRTLPALTLMAHYDSVPGSPGAADDITGVASILEIIRALETGGLQARDVMVVITDGEEAGLLGARAFFADHPLALHAGFVLNLETRGGGGRATMFETGAGNGAAIDLYRRTAVRPEANAMTGFVYKLLPNDTDYTVARQRGVFGFNYAFIGRQFDYHSPSSTVAALDKGSVQHVGDEVLGTARALAASPVLPARTADAVYSNILGDWLIAYPSWVGWLLLAAVAGLIWLGAMRARREGAWSWTDVFRGVGASVGILIGSALLLDMARTVTGVPSGWMAYRPLLARFPLFETAMGLVGAGSLVVIVAAMARPRSLTSDAAGGWTGLLAIGLGAATALQIIAPPIAFLVAWPLAAGAACSALLGGLGGRRPVAWGLTLAIIVLALAWLGGLFHGLLQGLDRAEVGAIVVWLAAMVLAPIAWPDQGSRRSNLVFGAALLTVGFGVALWLDLTNPWSARHPRAVMPLYVVETDTGKAWRATPLPVNSWTRAVLAADGGAIGRRNFPGFDAPLSAATARPVEEHAPPIAVARRSDGTVVVTAPMAAEATLALDLRCDVPVAATTLDAKPTPLLGRPGRWSHLRWRAAPEGVTFSFKPRSSGALDLRWAEYLDRWPARARPLPPMPANVMAWDMSGSTVLVGTRRFTWGT